MIFDVEAAVVESTDDVESAADVLIQFDLMGNLVQMMLYQLLPLNLLMLLNRLMMLKLLLLNLLMLLYQLLMFQFDLLRVFLQLQYQ